MKKRFKKFVGRIKEVIMNPVMQILPGQLAFYLFLSLIPLISLVVLIGSVFSISVSSVVDLIKSSFPASTSKLIIPLISGKGFDLSVLFFMVSAFALASNGTNSIVITSNILYGVENQNWIKRRIKAILLTVVIIMLLGFVIAVPAFGDLILSSIKGWKLISPIYNEVALIYNIFQLPLSFIFIYLNIKVIYTIAPDKQIKSKQSTYGALFTTVCWILATEFFSYYIANFAHYDIIYGGIANLVTLLFWVYLLSYIFVAGLALNASIQKEEPTDELKPEISQ